MQIIFLISKQIPEHKIQFRTKHYSHVYYKAENFERSVIKVIDRTFDVIVHLVNLS